MVFGEHKDMTFEKLMVYGNSWLELSRSLDRCHVHITNSTYISDSSTIDFSKTKWVGLYPAENVTDVTIGNINYREFFGVSGTNVNLVGKIHLAAEYTHKYAWQSKVIIKASNITMFQDAEIFGGYNLLHAKETLQMIEGSKIRSLRNNTCNLNPETHDMFKCIDKVPLDLNLTSAYIEEQYLKQFPNSERLEDFDTVLHGLLTNYTTYLAADQQVILKDAAVEGPRIGICTTNLTMIDSELNASGKGCKADEGLSRGRQIGECAGSGGANGGHGGYGGVVNESSEKHLDECKDHFP